MSTWSKPICWDKDSAVLHSFSKTTPPLELLERNSKQKLEPGNTFTYMAHSCSPHIIAFWSGLLFALKNISLLLYKSVWAFTPKLWIKGQDFGNPWLSLWPSPYRLTRIQKERTNLIKHQRSELGFPGFQKCWVMHLFFYNTLPVVFWYNTKRTMDESVFFVIVWHRELYLT